MKQTLKIISIEEHVDSIGFLYFKLVGKDSFTKVTQKQFEMYEIKEGVVLDTSSSTVKFSKRVSEYQLPVNCPSCNVPLKKSFVSSNTLVCESEHCEEKMFSSYRDFISKYKIDICWEAIIDNLKFLDNNNFNIFNLNKKQLKDSGWGKYYTSLYKSREIFAKDVILNLLQTDNYDFIKDNKKSMGKILDSLWRTFKTNLFDSKCYDDYKVIGKHKDKINIITDAIKYGVHNHLLLESFNIILTDKPLNSSFKSKVHEIIYALVEADGEQRGKLLNITKRHYNDKLLAIEWFETLEYYLDCNLPKSDMAMKVANEIFIRMTKHHIGKDFEKAMLDEIDDIPNIVTGTF